MEPNFFVLVASEPLLQTFDVNPFHGAGALARGYQRVFLKIIVLAEAYPAHLLILTSVASHRPIILTFLFCLRYIIEIIQRSLRTNPKTFLIWRFMIFW